jgi:hypothetical protein
MSPHPVASVLAALAVFLALPHVAAAQGAVSEENIRIARSLATMLQSARAVISAEQDLINDPEGGDKGLTGEVVLERAVANYREATGSDPAEADPASYEGRLLRAQMDAVVAVVDAHQSTINADGVGFKGFIPATFARLVNEEFGRRVGDEAAIKVTAPPDLVRNRQARPDDWEIAAIADYLLSADWPRGQLHSGIDDGGGAPRARVMVPEYYAASCLSCHGGPKGEVDITGYPKEGAREGDLGGVISIRLTPQ